MLSDLPNVPSFPWCQLSHMFMREGNPAHEFISEGFLRNEESSWGLVFNTFEELESPYL